MITATHNNRKYRFKLLCTADAALRLIRNNRAVWGWGWTVHAHTD